jgi:peptide methionine sulfoxide reductase MsrA
MNFGALSYEPENNTKNKESLYLQLSVSNTAVELETIYLAGGCFWGMEDILRKIPGVQETEAGYTGGWLENPRYDDTHDSKSGHAESVKVVFNPKVLPL